MRNLENLGNNSTSNKENSGPADKVPSKFRQLWSAATKKLVRQDDKILDLQHKHHNGHRKVLRGESSRNVLLDKLAEANVMQSTADAHTAT